MHRPRVSSLRSTLTLLVLALLAGAPAAAQEPAPSGPPQAPSSPAAGAPAALSQAREQIATAATDRRRENYRIGPGDVIEIRVLGEEQMSSDGERVSEDGFVRAPFVEEDIYAECMTERELSAVIAEKLRKWLRHPRVFVSVKEFNSTPVAVIGAVQEPKRLIMQRRMTLRELLTHVGGVDQAHGRKLYLVHNPEARSCDDEPDPLAASDPSVQVETLKVKDLLEGDNTQNRIMRPGDIVFVPPAEKVFVAGEVKKPGDFNLQEGMTFTKLLAMAGGFSDTAKKDKIRIYRQPDGAAERQEIVISYKDITEKKTEDPVLFPNDYIEVGNSASRAFWKGFVQAIGGGVGNLPVTVIP